jgi:hypothetical protein
LSKQSPREPIETSIPTARHRRVKISDVHYTSAQFTDALDDHGVAGSLGSTGDAYDKELVSQCTSWE